MSTRLLLVEDDVRLSQLICAFLTQHGFEVKALLDGQQLSRTVLEFQPQVVVLDIMLPGEDGLTLCKRLRKTYQGVLLFLTAQSSDVDHVLGLELGADDYIIKPVEPRVLLARIQALLRRAKQHLNPGQLNNNICFGQLTLNRQSRQVTLKKEQIDFTSHEFDMLWLLASHPSELVEREIIYTDLIGRQYDGLDRSADVRISRIRKKLHDNPQNPFKIKTIWGKGFFFVPDVWE